MAEKHTKGVQYTLRSVPRAVDRALRRRAREEGIRTTLVLMATSVLITLSANCGCQSTRRTALWQQPAGSSRSDGEKQWWFPSGPTEPMLLRYHLDYTVSVYEPDEEPVPRRQEMTFALRVDHVDDADARRIRLHREKGETREAHELSVWLHLFETLYSGGLLVTDSDVSSKDAPLLRGPWRSGDRITLGWAVITLGTTGGIIHAEITHADPQRMELEFGLFGGPLRPDWEGGGTVSVQTDDHGILRLDAQFQWTLRGVKLEGDMRVRRVAVVPISDLTP